MQVPQYEADIRKIIYLDINVKSIFITEQHMIYIWDS